MIVIFEDGRKIENVSRIEVQYGIGVTRLVGINGEELMSGDQLVDQQYKVED